MQQADFFRAAIETLERLQIPYMVVGSAASSIYGEPRMTQDIDIVIDPTPSQLEQLCDAFPFEEFYLSKEAARDALARRLQFNVIHPESGNKVDFIIAQEDPWGRVQLSRRRVIPFLPELSAAVAAPEDVIISKMRYFQEGASDKHLRDIAGMFEVSDNEIDRAYIEKWAGELGLMEIWRSVRQRLGK